MASLTKKKGAMSEAECVRLSELARMGLPVCDMADILERTEETIIEKLQLLRQAVKDTDIEGLRKTLRRKHYWESVKKCLMDKAEEKLFEEQWCRLMRQLAKYDVLETDELMVRDLCLQEIDALRTRANIKNCNTTRMELASQLDDLGRNFIEGNKQQIDDLRRQVQGLDQNIRGLNEQLTEIKKNKEVTFKSLKTTRDQRLADIREQNKDPFLILNALTDLDKRAEEGRITELMDMSSQKIAKKWGQPVMFSDGEIDRVLLNHETVLEQYEDEIKNVEDEE